MNSDALDILAWTLLGEAGGEGDAGMAAVAHTIRNRAGDPRWPSDPMAVALQPYQYSTWNDTRQGGNSPSERYPKSSEEFQNARRIAEQVFSGSVPDPTGGATHYHTKSISPSWASAVNQFGKIGLGNHVFYPEHPVPPASLPEVATALDVIERMAPTPASADDRVAARNAWATSYVPPPLPQARPERQRSAPPLPRPMPERTRETPPLPRARPNDLAPSRQAPVPASVERRVTARNAALPPVVRLPDLPPPTPRSAPTPARQSLPLSSARAGAAATPPALQAALNKSISAPRADGIGAMPSMADMASVFGVSAVPGVNSVAQAQDRLTTAGLPPANYGTVMPSGIGGPDLVMPPVPQPRPQRPVPAPVQKIAPTPAPRLDRPGIFGTPKIGNWEIPLPGALGRFNDFTKAMANASGPFNNGFDNLVYSTMRGGDFNTPGAATRQSAGYLYAPREGGGWTNVGRVNSDLTPAQRYEANRTRWRDSGSSGGSSDWEAQAKGLNSGRY